ncbi:MarR family transcriptional regulator [Desulfobulbus sp. US1]|uniref:DNA-binding transcriptional regulator GbsR, MarR family n=1 Tax=Candidatus Electrothrix communis TaxID=1859133 RepID=A0A3S3QHQ6_9BACT|nr:MarR family transcriptional regulator [Desulfobulbus sp. US4]MCW5207081.1 MarR family transcriptional regulator [Desulfobulbus sp. US2]MCW5209548.1 MarR family transcriptional regulator [Desulfobulbus sp. US1]MCW5210580.1 MarR family transcriptional regulator [Desulfobulbus sp. N3]RWX44780.1 DNA-binding transcriptional regulator GbsR, MarR family [Candidatus Electrothrix communis]
MNSAEHIAEARKNLVETGGRTSQDLGLGRIVGQVLVYLYLQPKECSLDVLEQELGLSKASVSVAARQLESLGLVQRVWIKGERKKYYRSAENIARALQQGVLSMLRHKVEYFGGELEKSMNLLDGEVASENEEDRDFLRQRVKRAKKLQERLDSVLGNPLVHLLAKMNRK